MDLLKVLKLSEDTILSGTIPSLNLLVNPSIPMYLRRYIINNTFSIILKCISLNHYVVHFWLVPECKHRLSRPSARHMFLQGYGDFSFIVHNLLRPVSNVMILDLSSAYFVSTKALRRAGLP